MKPIPSKKFLFFDYWTYEYVKGFKRTLEMPVKYENNPVFIANNSNYEFNNCFYTTVIYDNSENIFKMWYGTSNYYNETIEPIKYLCYAVSDDGISWDRPELDIVPGTNVVMDRNEHAMGTSVIKDLFDNKNQYKLLMRPKNIPAITAYTSKDGLNWEKASEKPVIYADSDSKIGLYQDPESGRYHALFREYKGNRRTWMSESNDFITWSRPVMILEPHIDEGCQAQIYGTQASSYGNYVIGLAPMYNTVEADMFWAKMEGTMDIEIAFSKGSYNFRWLQPCSRFLRNGSNEEWDRGMIHPTTTPIYLKDEIRFYYSGSRFTHGSTQMVKTQPQAIGFASLRPDGFIGLEAGNEKSFLLTRPFSIVNADIYINADSSRGYIKVEVCDADTNKPIKGYEMENCIDISQDETVIPVVWKVSEKENIINRPIRIRIEAVNSKLYSITMPNGNDVSRYWEFSEIGCVDPVRDLNANDYFMRI